MNPYSTMWHAIAEQASAWVDAPAVEEMKRGMLRTGQSQSDVVATAIQELKAGFGGMMNQPMRLGSTVANLLTQEYAGRRSISANDPAMQAWITAAGRVEHGHRLTLAWIRSRLPHFPIIRAPQLAPNTPLTTYEFTPRLTWPIEERRMALQLDLRPPDLGAILGTDVPTTSRMSDLAIQVVDALRGTDEWARFATAAASLDNAGKESLRAAYAELKTRLSPAAVDEHEPNFAWPRNNYRAHATSQVVDALEGTAFEYAQSFEGLNSLVDLSEGDILGNLIAQAEVPIIAITNLEFGGSDTDKIEFESDGSFGWRLECGDIAWLNDPFIADAVRLESITTNVAGTGAMRVRYAATVLGGTAGGWARPTA